MSHIHNRERLSSIQKFVDRYKCCFRPHQPSNSICYADRYSTTSCKRNLNIFIQMVRISLFIYGLFNDAVSSTDYKQSRESTMIREIRMEPLLHTAVAPVENPAESLITRYIKLSYFPHFSPAPFHSYMLLKDTSNPTLNAISHEYQAQTVNRKPSLLYSTLRFTY
jgi:hypothetical protein